MADAAFALVLNLHQPAYNLEDLLRTRELEANEIPWVMDRIPRSLWACEDIGRGAPVAVRHPAGDLGQPRLPAPRLRRRRLRIAAVGPPALPPDPAIYVLAAPGVLPPCCLRGTRRDLPCTSAGEPRTP